MSLRARAGDLEEEERGAAAELTAGGFPRRRHQRSRRRRTGVRSRDAGRGDVRLGPQVHSRRLPAERRGWGGGAVAGVFLFPRPGRPEAGLACRGGSGAGAAEGRGLLRPADVHLPRCHTVSWRRSIHLVCLES